MIKMFIYKGFKMYTIQMGNTCLMKKRESSKLKQIMKKYFCKNQMIVNGILFDKLMHVDIASFIDLKLKLQNRL